MKKKKTDTFSGGRSSSSVSSGPVDELSIFSLAELTGTVGFFLGFERLSGPSFNDGVQEIKINIRNIICDIVAMLQCQCAGNIEKKSTVFNGGGWSLAPPTSDEVTSLTGGC